MLCPIIRSAQQLCITSFPCKSSPLTSKCLQRYYQESSPNNFEEPFLNPLMKGKLVWQANWCDRSSQNVTQRLQNKQDFELEEKATSSRQKIGTLLQIARHACEHCRTITHNVWHATRTGESTKLPCLCSQNTLWKADSAGQYVCLPSYQGGRWEITFMTHIPLKLTNPHALESMSYSDNLTLWLQMG